MPQSDQSPVEQTILRATLLPPTIEVSLPSVAEGNFGDRAASFWATTLLLALADFHREHGRCSVALDELIPTYFAEVPRDPLTADPFVYFPYGVPEDVIVGSEKDSDSYVMIRKSIPLLLT